MTFYTHKVLCYVHLRRRTTDEFSSVPAANFELLAVQRATAADRPPAAAVAGRAVPAANPLLAVPVATHIAATPTARSAHHAGHTTADAAPATRGHVQSHTLRVRVEHRSLHATESSILHNERRSDGHALGCGLTRRETTVGGNRRRRATDTTFATRSPPTTTGRPARRQRRGTSHTRPTIITPRPSRDVDKLRKVQTAAYLTCLYI